MDDAEVVTMLRSVFSEVKGNDWRKNRFPIMSGVRQVSIDHPLFNDMARLFWLIDECRERRIVEAYDEMIEIIDYFSRTPGLNINDYSGLKQLFDASAIYFSYVWCENKQTLDKERPEKIFVRLADDECGFWTRAIVFALVTFDKGEIGYMDTPGGGIGNMDLD